MRSITEGNQNRVARVYLHTTAKRDRTGGHPMHAYQHYAVKASLTTCPSCMKRAEIVDTFTLPSTDGRRDRRQFCAIGAASRSLAVIVVTGSPRPATFDGRSRRSHLDTFAGSVEMMISP